MNNQWPQLSYDEGKETYETLHMFTQVIGKIKLETLPWQNHSWHVTLKFTPSGLTTAPLPYSEGYFQIDLDFIDHNLLITTSHGELKKFPLCGISVAQFYNKLFSLLKELRINEKIYTKPVEVEDPIRFEEDTVHNTYHKDHARALHRSMLLIQEVFYCHRCGFKGKSSEVHFFWGSFDLAVSFFTGKKAPKHPGGIPNLPNWVAEEAYSHEVMSFGFWPGSAALPEAAFYSYLYPEPLGFNNALVQPKEAFYNKDLREFVLPYKAVQQASDPPAKLREFLDSAYNAGTLKGNWDIGSLE